MLVCLLWCLCIKFWLDCCKWRFLEEDQQEDLHKAVSDSFRDVGDGDVIFYYEMLLVEKLSWSENSNLIERERASTMWLLFVLARASDFNVCSSVHTDYYVSWSDLGLSSQCPISRNLRVILVSYPYVLNRSARLLPVRFRNFARSLERVVKRLIW